MKIKVASLVLLFLLTQVAATRASEIVVKDADSVWEVTTAYSAQLITTASSALPRVSVEYSSSIYSGSLYGIPAGLNELTGELLPTRRLIVRQAGSIYASNLHEVPADLAGTTGELTLTGRVIVDHASLIYTSNLHEIPADLVGITEELSPTRRLIIKYAGSTHRLALTFPQELLGVPVLHLPHIALSATAHDFGRIPVDSPANWTLVVSNAGDATLKVEAITSISLAFTIPSPEFPQDIASGDSLNVTVRFSPTEEKAYTGTLTIASNDPDEPEVYVSVEGEGRVEKPPVADAGTDQSVSSGYLVLFDGSNSDDPDGTIVRYQWNFGDGKTAATSAVNHRFRGAMDVPKTYAVTLTVEDNEGLTDTDTVSVTVRPLEKTVEITYQPAVPIPGQPVFARMMVSYNWIGIDQNVEDVYIISKIYRQNGGFDGYYDLCIWNRSTVIPTLLWSDWVLTWPAEKTYTPPFKPTPVLGTPCSISEYTFDDGTFRGILVRASDAMSTVAVGWAGISISVGPFFPPPFIKWSKATFMPEPTEVPDLPIEIPNGDLAHLCSPGELRVCDSQGKVTGWVNGEVKEEIPFSGYQNGTVIVLDPSDSYRYEVVGTDEGKYGLAVSSVTEEKTEVFGATDIPTSPRAVHQYAIDWDALSKQEKGVTLQMDSDGDGTFEYTVTAGNTLTPVDLGVPSITFTDLDALLAGEQTGDVAIRYLIGNESGGSVNLACEYSDDSGATWHGATVEGDTAGIDSTRYRGSLVWKSSADLPGVDKGTVRFRITPRDVRPGIPDETGDFHLDNNAPPSVILRDVSELQTGSIGIGYTLSDAEHDSLSLRSVYWDAGTSAWVDAAVEGSTEHILNYEGEIVWDTGKDLPEKAIRVPFRITPSDHDPGTADTTVVFVDNVTPSISLTDPEGDQSGDVVIGMEIANDTLSVVSLACAYSEDGGTSWKTATVEGDISEIAFDGYVGEMIWKSRADLPDTDVETVRFRITPRDALHEGAPVQTSAFHLDNLPPTSLTAGGTFGGATIGLRLNEEVEQASAETVVHYGLSHELTVSSAIFVAPDSVVLALGPDQVLPFEEITVTVVGIRDALGNEVVTPLQSVFKPVNTPPGITLEDVVGEVSGDVMIQYELSDVEGNPVHLRCAYSVDDLSWHSATVVGDTLMDREGYQGFVTWKSQIDLPGTDRSTVRFRITPYDGEPGAPGTTVPFHLDNNRPPLVTLQKIEDTQTGDVPIFYMLFDEESDLLNLLCQFSVDGTSWQPATVEGDTAGIGPAAYAGELLWRSLMDLGAFVGTVSFRAIPRDRDQGTGDVITIMVDYVVPTIELEDVVGEQSGDVILRYVITDQGQNLLSLHCEYSENSGASWHKATVAGDTAGIGPTQYEGFITWNSGVDLAGVDRAIVRFRIIPMDPRPGIPDETGDFHLDNNQPPAVELAEIAAERARDVTIAYQLSDPEGDSLSITCEYSSDGGQTWKAATVTGKTAGIVASEYSGQITWHSFEDLGYGKYPGIQFRMTPADNDPGASGVSTAFQVRNLAADYDGDLDVDFDDLTIFLTAWEQNDLHKEIGPATGTMPDLVPQPDGVLDFEDLAVFILMWNWSAQREAGKLARALPAQGTAVKITVSSQGPEVRVEARTDHLPDLLAVQLLLQYDSEIFSCEGVESGDIFGSNGLFLRKIDNQKGTVLINTGRLGGKSLPTGLLAKLRFSRLSDASGEIVTFYDLRGTGGERVAAGRAVSEITRKAEEAFGLLQNWPNPFNSGTVISYILPEASVVSLKVFNTLGQEVKVLTDGVQEPGRFTVRWDGRNEVGQLVASGIYLCRMSAKSVSTADVRFAKNVKMILLR